MIFSKCAWDSVAHTRITIITVQICFAFIHSVCLWCVSTVVDHEVSKEVKTSKDGTTYITLYGRDARRTRAFAAGPGGKVQSSVHDSTTLQVAAGRFVAGRQSVLHVERGREAPAVAL